MLSCMITNCIILSYIMLYYNVLNYSIPHCTTFYNIITCCIHTHIQHMHVDYKYLCVLIYNLFYAQALKPAEDASWQRPKQCCYLRASFG